MNSLQGYIVDPKTQRILSEKNTAAREWARRHRDGTPEWRETLRCYRDNFMRTAPLAQVKMRRLREMLYRAKHRAKKRGLPFRITVHDIPEFPDFCPITGRPFRLRQRKGPHPDSPSLDRIDPKRGYVPGNVRVISHWANSNKGNASPAQLRRQYLSLLWAHAPALGKEMARPKTQMAIAATLAPEVARILAGILK